ncbi:MULTISPECIES: type II toxin-antitoxin system RelB/DinJ family antitoxin [Gordonibacter]|uniref:Type II toxin-antitoxin system RelB/DinJ family antitoxin n=1 Tax=Gordonibacter faecis TaxID=3047475 RepID=A0ABT7DNM6_9ACTN|nr:MULTISPECIES: type II toxin-antitoxin system RelB/DinJ family antitoxin [unclassified Gordonibacter]MDJ1650146.1 type II toxin-antitoxin system RelB/DinJ family antitoxin [Gordonibacter sp. KGMB12511]HIW75590.1 type II toxin-antitoxin system RelB/DinJ family antitoxin [Candidatus Gordonibacter avicola]
MAQTTLSVRMDEEVKRGLEAFCADVGMNTSVAINMFAKAVLRERRLPFEVVSYNLDPFYSPANQERLVKAKERMERNGGTAHELIEDEND